MKVRRVLVGAAFCAATALWSSSVYSQTKDEKKPAGDKPAGAQPPAAKPVGGKPTAPTAAKPGDKPAGDKGGGGSEAESMMKMMQEMSAPGKEHEALKPLVGAVTCSTKFYSGPRDPPQE